MATAELGAITLPVFLQFLGKLCLCDLAAHITLVMSGKIVDLDFLASFVFALLDGDCNALTLPLQKVGALKLVDCTDHSQHELSCGGTCVDALLVTDKVNSLGGKLLHDFKQVLCRAGNAAEIVNVNCVALSCKFKHCLKLGTAHVLCAYLLSKPFVDAVFL